MEKIVIRKSTVIVLLLIVGVAYAGIRFMQRSSGFLPTGSGQYEGNVPPSGAPGDGNVESSQSGNTIPSLFNGIEWKHDTEASVVFRTRDNGLITLDGYSYWSEPLDACPKDFLAYYRDQLTNLGWRETWNAGGTCDGEQHGYEAPGFYLQFGVVQREDGYFGYIEYALH